jgi:hypothetical protein
MSTAPSRTSGTVVSSDGTAIGFTRSGDGPPMVVVDGALCYRAFGPSAKLADRLSRHATVYTYDRRGRGESRDTPPYAVEREVDDLAAVIAEAGGSACVFAESSGAALALEAAHRGLPIQRLAVFEAPFVVDPDAARPEDFLGRLDALVAADRRGDAVRYFLRSVGTPAVVVALMRVLPAWPKLTGVAHTLPYDVRALGDTGSGTPLPADRWAGATMPTLVLDGGKSPAPMRAAMRQLADVLPNAEHRTLPGQTHLLKADAVAPVLAEFFRV